MTLPPAWNLGAVAVLGLIGLLLVGGFMRGPYDALRDARMRKMSELPQSGLLVLLSLLVVGVQGVSPLALFTLGGIAFGFLGDLFIANVFRRKNPIPLGMLSFAAGHVLYMLAMLWIANDLHLDALSAYGLALIGAWLVALAAWVGLVRSPTLGNIQYAALVYGLFLASACGIAFGLALQRSQFWPLAIGSALFVLSDMILAAQLFAGRHFRYMGDVVWTTYILAQVLIVTSLLGAVPL